jgi:hypothetical protein
MTVLQRLALASVFVLSIAVAGADDSAARPGKVAAKPLFRDPVYDGAADPTVIYNRVEKKWFMFYTNRRASLTNGAISRRTFNWRRREHQCTESITYESWSISRIIRSEFRVHAVRA